jgi:hypothetical protein
MAATTIKVDQSQKQRLDRLQARLQLIAGRRVTQSELLELLVRHAEGDPEALLRGHWRPLTREEIEKVLRTPMDLGFQIGDVDEGVYGKRKR